MHPKRDRSLTKATFDWGSQWPPKIPVDHRIQLASSESCVGGLSSLRLSSSGVNWRPTDWSCVGKIQRRARTCEAWFQLTFRPQKWNLKSAHVVSAVSGPYSSNVAICDAAPPRQHSPILRYPALLRYSVLCFNSITQCKLTRYRNDGGVRKPSIRHLATYFPKQIPTPSRFKFILLLITGLTEKIMIHVLSGLKTSVGV